MYSRSASETRGTSGAEDTSDLHSPVRCSSIGTTPALVLEGGRAMTSASTPRPEEEWLSLREAAELLGMHPATVRLWADRNALPSRRTSGGHRRFRRSDIEANFRQESERKPHPAARLLVQSVLGRVREAYRRLGRRLLELLLRALTEAGAYPELLHEAAHLGHEYGSITRASHVPV